ncbi:phosphotriesterase-related protein isoform X3 [Anolis carolinensis]|uniref:phosphotriesterase-related protein isoform X3 n=1 Tax=Anolis carolinensis TaxID=28377 RepID=UPI002F2B330F
MLILRPTARRAWLARLRGGPGGRRSSGKHGGGALNTKPTPRVWERKKPRRKEHWRNKVEMSSQRGKIQTVLGLIKPSQLGSTLTHEHLTMSFSCCYYPPPPGQEELSEKSIEMKNLFWLKQNPYSNKENLLLYQETDAVREELLHYKAAGGGAIVENTTTGLMRDMKTLKHLAEETGVHIIAGAGFYVDATHSPETRAMSVEQLTDVIINEVLNGADGTDIKCGVIGEIGCSWPLTESENKVVQATAHAQSQLGCPVIIHPGRHSDSPFQIMRVLQEAGGDVSKTVMSHLDRTIFDEKKLLEFAQLGCYLEYDLFGTEFLLYQMCPDIDMPSDNERILRYCQGFGC